MDFNDYRQDSSTVAFPNATCVAMEIRGFLFQNQRAEGLFRSFCPR